MLPRITSAAQFALGAIAISLAAFLPAHLPGGVIPTVLADDTFTVNSVADGADSAPGDGMCTVAPGGACTLRSAIEESNATLGRDTIAFNIDGVPMIAPLAALPSLSDPVVIDGTTQPGFRGKPLVELDGALAGNSSGLTLTAGNSLIKGLVVNRFTYAGIVLAGSANNVIQGNLIGTDSSGTQDRGNGLDGIHAAGLGLENNLIGGTRPSERNVLSGNGGYGLVLGPGENRVEGNFIGTDYTGNSPIGNSSSGVLVCGCDAGGQVTGLPLIGGSEPGTGNLISGNRFHGILGAGIVNVLGNKIGTNAGGNGAVGNGHAGIAISSDGETGAYLIARMNIVAHNGDQGIVADTGIALGNSIYSNGGPGLSIDNIDNNPVLAAPSLTSAFHRRGRLTVSGTAHATPGASLEIEVFANDACDPSGFGEGRRLVSSLTLTADGAGNVSFSITVKGASARISYVTATMTTDLGVPSTSNFSNCVPVSGP